VSSIILLRTSKVLVLWLAVLLNYTTIIILLWLVGCRGQEIFMYVSKKKKKRGIVDMVSQWHVTRKNYLTFNNGGNKSDDCL